MEDGCEWQLGQRADLEESGRRVWEDVQVDGVVEKVEESWTCVEKYAPEPTLGQDLARQRCEALLLRRKYRDSNAELQQF